MIYYEQIAVFAVVPKGVNKKALRAQESSQVVFWPFWLKSVLVSPESQRF